MPKMIVALLLALAGLGPAPLRAEACPPLYRFVDFGVEGPDGVVRRGGVIFRAFAADGAPLLHPEQTLCRAVDEVSRDGRALPIPVVTGIGVRPDVAGPDLRSAGLQSLGLSLLHDAGAAAEASAARHRAALAETGAVTARGVDFLCVARPGESAASCQILSPYDAAVPLVVYCDAQRCAMPVLARDAGLAISAAWDRRAGAPEDLGAETSQVVQSIHAFVEEQI